MCFLAFSVLRVGKHQNIFSNISLDTPEQYSENRTVVSSGSGKGCGSGKGAV